MVGGMVGRRKKRLRPTHLLRGITERVVRPIEIYNWAIGQSGNAATEVEQRTVVSRLYYGLHHEACCRYYRKNPAAAALNRSNRHAGLAVSFNSASDGTSKNIGNLLKDLRDLRVQADYVLSPPTYYRGKRINWGSLVTMAVMHGEQLLEELEQYSPGEAGDGCRCLIQ